MNVLKKPQTTAKQLILLLLVFGVITGLFYLLFDVQEETVDKGFNETARSNPFHAAALYLNQLGIATTIVNGYNDIEDVIQGDGTIIVTDSRRFLSRKQNEKLLDWVKAGGSLIVYVEPPQKSSSWIDVFRNDSNEPEGNDPILTSVGARVYEVESEAADEPSDEDKKATIKCTSPLKQGTTSCIEIVFKGDDTPLFIEFSHKTAIEDQSGNANAAIGSEKGFHLIQYDVGKGLLTLLTDMDFWTNNRIALNDHAFLLESFAGGSSSVRFISHGRSLSLLELIWKVAHFVIFWLVLSAILLLWRQGYRFGPVLPGPSPTNRKLMEHITASSHFLWRKKKETYMIQQLQEVIEHRMQKRQPGYHPLNDSERVDAIRRVTHLTRQDIEQAFKNKDRFSKSEFLKTIKALQQIGKKL